MIRLFVADDHPITRAGVVGLIEGTEIQVSGDAATCNDAVRQTLRMDPDVVLLDVRMPESDGFQALQQIKEKKPNLPVLMFSVSDSLQEINRAHQRGAAGFVPKGASREAFLTAVRKAATGKSAWTRQQLRRLRHNEEPDELINDNTVNLTPREREVLKQMVQGLVNEDIGTELGIDIETVKQHVKHILQKLGVVDRTQAALWAVRNKLE
jgi:DNA-binding NarL/FixJ family response regulator